MDQNCHRRKITLLFESEYFPEIKIESVILSEIEELPKKLNGNVKIPVIGFFDSSAVICVSKNGEYKFLDSMNGLYGNELFINFEESKAKYVMESIKAGKTKMSSVVYDLIKIMAMPPGKIIEKEEWKFVVTKNSEYPVLIEFVNHEGRKQAGTPSFLMAMLLKEMLKRIKNELNEEKPKEIGLCFFDKMFEDEKKRVENGLKEACELLKVESIFIDV
uniref:NurA domain-containing protein n=1 Tax=Panagrolaimus davidi TaxID=227884 RepID=A0A914R0P3_9BILA